MYRLRTLNMTIWRTALVIRYFLYVWILLVELYNILMKMASLLFGIWHFSHDSKRWNPSLIRVDHRQWRLSFVYRADRADRLDTMFTNQTTMNKRSCITHTHTLGSASHVAPTNDAPSRFDRICQSSACNYFSHGIKVYFFSLSYTASINAASPT